VGGTGAAACATHVEWSAHAQRLHVNLPPADPVPQVLRIPAANVLRDAAVRQNLRLQVVRSAGGSSSQASRERACALFAAGGPLAASRSAIVYCAFKEDANQLARMLGARGVSARAYHAGKDYRVRVGATCGVQGCRLLWCRQAAVVLPPHRLPTWRTNRH